jgi:hypothetical protein
MHLSNNGQLNNLLMCPRILDHYKQYRRAIKRDVFLQTMDQIVPWSELCEVIKPHYALGKGGRPPIGNPLIEMRAAFVRLAQAKVG